MMQKMMLNERETEILDLVAVGKSYKKVAQILALSLPTIKFYMRTAREKLGAQNSNHAIAIFVENRAVKQI